MIGNGKIGLSKVGAIVTEEIGNNLVFTKECVFSISKRFPIGSSGVVDIVFDPTAFGLDGFVVFLPVFFQAFGAGPIQIDLYFGVDSDEDGTLWTGFNRNNESIKTASSCARLNPTINSSGAKLEPEFEIPSNGTAAVAVAGGSSTEALVTNIRKDGKYMFRLTNIEASAATAVFTANWFELS